MTIYNVTEQRRVTQRGVDGSGCPVRYGDFSSESERRAIVNIFTDVDCGYCRKLHNEINQYAELGIEVRYLPTRERASNLRRHLRCARFGVCDPASAMTRAKNSQRIAQRDCPTDPVDEQFALGRRLGVSGTPSIVTDAGDMFPAIFPPSSWLSGSVSASSPPAPRHLNSRETTLTEIKLGIAGLGTVAHGVLELIRRNNALMRQRSGVPLRVVRVASRRAVPEIDLQGAHFSTDIEDLLTDPNVDMIWS